MSQQKEQKEAVLVKRAAAELACALLFFAIGGVVIWSSLEIGSGWGPRGPQSGYFPLRIGIILCVAALGVAVEAWRTKRASGNAESFVTRAELKPVLQVLLPIVLFVVVTDYLGIYLAAFGLIAGFMRKLGHYGWLRCVLVAGAVTAVTFWLFEIQFLVPLAKGPIEAALGY